MSLTSAGTSANSPEPLTTEQAITRAQTIIEKAESLHHAAQGLVDVEDETLRRAAENVNNYHLVKYQAVTTPDVLWPVLQALIDAAETPAAIEKG